MRKKIVFDLDGVLVDFTAGMRPIMAEHFKYDPFMFYGRTEPKNWNWSDLGAKKEDVSAIWETIVKTDDFWENLPHLEGLSHLAAALYRGDILGNDLIFLTSRPETLGNSTWEQSERWITRKLGLHHPHVIVVPNALGKLKILESLVEFPTYFIDDFAPTVQMAKYLSKAVMLRQPWNAHDEAAYSIKSVSSVHEFLEEVKRGV